MSILLLGAGLGATQTRLLDYAPGASAAYSLRQVGRQYNGPVVRVRRESDSTERDFTASQIDNGTLTTWVNATPDLPLDQSSGAAAAYSLRSLSSSYSGNVIRARRASDNDERDFTANEIIDGTLTTWTNASVALPLDEASGAAAAYSLRNLRASYTGDVIRVRRTSDNAELDFSASEITDGTLESWVDTENIFYSADFSTGIGGWFEPYPYGTLTYNVDTDDDGSGVPPSDNWLKIECSAVGGRIYLSGNTALNNDIASLGGGDYKLEFDYYNPDSSFSFSNIYISSEPTQYWGIATLSNGSGSYSQTLTLTEAEAVGISDFRFGNTNDTSGRTLYIKNLKITKTDANGYVKTWYDQSGNDNDATQTTAGYQPKIVSAGALITENSKPAIEFDGTDDRLSFSDIATDSPMTGFSVTRRQAAGKRSVVVCNGATLSGTLFGYEYNDNKTYASNRDGYIVASSATASQVMYTAISADSSDRSSLSLYRNGVLLAVSSASLPHTLPLNSIGKRATEFQTGTAQEFVIYKSDLTSQRTAIEANLAEFYGIDLPEGVDTANNEVDAFVTTWYDQSGNGNHAVQITATYQPKIVNAGALITQNGKPTMRFDGVDDTMLVTPYDAEDGLLYLSRFAVAEKITATGGILTTTSDDNIGLYGGGRFFSTLSNSLQWAAGNSGFTVTSVNVTDVGYGLVSNGLHLISSIYDGTQSTVSDAITPFLDGDSPTLTSTTGSVISPLLSGSTRLHIGSNVAANNFWNGNIAEYIIYPSDQSDFRQGIETNTALHYNIFTTMKYKVQSNEVDGYVATWYDQSGNGYDAAQTTADYQPKLVDSGAIIEENGEPALRFDGVDDYLSQSSINISQPNSFFIVAKRDSLDGKQNYVDGITNRQEISLQASSDLIAMYANSLVTGVTGTTDQEVNFVLFDGASSKWLIDSVSSASGDTGLSSINNLVIGADEDQSDYLNGIMQEIVLYPSDKSNQRQRIEGNLAWKYGIQDKLPWNHPYARSFPGFGSQRVPVDSDAIAYLTAVAEADGVGVEVPIANAIEDFILGCKSDGIWSSIKASCILCGARTISGALVPLKGDAPTAEGGWASGDYDRPTGMKGNGTSLYLNTNYQVPESDLNDTHIACHVTLAATNAVHYKMGAYATTPAQNITAFRSQGSGVFSIYNNSSAGAFAGSGTDNVTGFHGQSRASSTSVTARVSNTSYPLSIPSTTVVPMPLFLFTTNLNNSGTYQKFDGRIAFYSIGTKINNLAQLDTRVSNLIASINLYLDIGLNPDNYDQDTINYIYNAYKAGGSLA